MVLKPAPKLSEPVRFSSTVNLQVLSSFDSRIDRIGIDLGKVSEVLQALLADIHPHGVEDVTGAMSTSRRMTLSFVRVLPTMVIRSTKERSPSLIS